MNQPNNKNFIIGIIIITIIIFVGLVLVLVNTSSNSSSGEIKDEKVSFSDDNDPAIGSPASATVVHIYGDFQCPACRVAEPGLKYAMEKYRDRVRFVWKDFPLMQIHPNARPAANAARCAQVQGKFWEYHDELYTNQTAWASQSDARGTFIEYAKNVGLEPSVFQTCLASQAEDAKVTANMSEGGRNRVDATPTFFINQRRYFAMTPQEWDVVMGKTLDIRH
ncbi:MAG: thioredoxin domain-containing protein [Candidatus Uhrbacteria bacterium]|nr:thioredoxin domain-containing protein [Candidatus Uhrbacteria bacterium]